MAIYIYGVLNSNRSVSLVVNEPLTRGEPLTRDMGGGKVYSIPYKDVSMLVGVAAPVDYLSLPKEKLAGLLLKHQRVIEKVMATGISVVPVQLATYAKDEKEVVSILARWYKVIKSAVARTSDLLELDLVCTWQDFERTLKEAGEETEVREYREKLLKEEEKITESVMIKVGTMVRKVLDRKRQECAHLIEDTLKSSCKDMRPHQTMDDTMLMNTAFLIEAEKQGEFADRVEKLDKTLGERVSFRIVGPLPPYSFSTLEIKRMEFQEIDWARKTLGLDVTASRGEIKKVYRAKAFSSHPDRRMNFPEPVAEKQFEELPRAYKLLVEYCTAIGNSDQSSTCSFKEEDFNNYSTIVRIRN
jgi:hypothetical protein